MTDETEPHPIARASLYERMSNIAREAGGNPAPSPIEAASAHLGGVADPILDHAAADARGCLEDAMIAGADLETGELPAREEPVRISGPDADAIAAIGESAGIPAEVVERAPAPAAPVPPPPERQTFNSAPPPPAQPESSKQEVIEPELAADGRPAPFAARDAGTLINMLENGQLSADVIAAMTALTQGMTEIAEATGKRQKGTLTIKINLSTDDTGEAFFVQGEFAVRAPKVERRKTLLWPDEKGHLSPSQPRQRIMFGIKDAGGGPRQIRDATAERRPL